MFVKLLPAQLKAYDELIHKTIDKSIKDITDRMRTALIRDLMLDIASCWVYQKEGSDEVGGMIIIRVTEDYALGGKFLTILASHAPKGTEEDMFIDGWGKLSKYAKKYNCTHMDFFTDNATIMKYAEMFNPTWKTNYYQLKF